MQSKPRVLLKDERVHTIFFLLLKERKWQNALLQRVQSDLHAADSPFGLMIAFHYHISQQLAVNVAVPAGSEET